MQAILSVFIYERQNCLFVLIMHGTDRTGSNAQTSEYNHSDSSTQHIQAESQQQIFTALNQVLIITKRCFNQISASNHLCNHNHDKSGYSLY